MNNPLPQSGQLMKYMAAYLLLLGMAAMPLIAQSGAGTPDLDSIKVHGIMGVNTTDLEYAPTVTADGKTLYFVSDRPGGVEGHDIWVATFGDRRDTFVTSVRNLGPTMNSQLNEGVASISADGQTMYFTACNRDDGVGDCDIYEARLDGTTWRVVRNVTEVNSSEWDSQPSISSDGRMLYFVSNRIGTMGGIGDCDIYVSTRAANGKWSRPRNVGGPINTRQRQDSPFIFPGSGALYFSSAGHGGIGGLDFFVSRRNSDNEWEEPENLGEPLNTNRDERFITLPASGDVVYFSSERWSKTPGMGMLDLFVGLLPPRVATVLVEGRVYDRVTGASLTADLMFIDSASGETIQGTATNSATGEYSLVINAGPASTIEVYGVSTGYSPIRATIHVPEASSYTELLNDFPLNASVISVDAASSAETGTRAFTVHPNPATHSLTIDIAGTTLPEGTKDLEVIDAYGNLVLETSFSGQKGTIDLDELPNGVYLVRIGGMATAFVVRR